MYYGVVRRSCLDRVRADAGACFPGPSPDMANAFALSFAVGRMSVAELPVFIAGNSRKSNAGLVLRGQHVGEIPSLPFLPRDTAERWNPSIPYFWSGQTIWCQSAYAAAAALGRAEEFEAANDYRALYARVLVFQPRFALRVLRAFSARHAQLGVLRFSLEATATVAAAGALGVARVVGFMQRWLRARVSPAAGGLLETGVPSVIDATRRVDATIGSTNLGAWLDRGLKTGVGSAA